MMSRSVTLCPAFATLVLICLGAVVCESTPTPDSTAPPSSGNMARTKTYTGSMYCRMFGCDVPGEALAEDHQSGDGLGNLIAPLREQGAHTAGVQQDTLSGAGDEDIPIATEAISLVTDDLLSETDFVPSEIDNVPAETVVSSESEQDEAAETTTSLEIVSLPEIDIASSEIDNLRSETRDQSSETDYVSSEINRTTQPEDASHSNDDEVPAVTSNAEPTNDGSEVPATEAAGVDVLPENEVPETSDEMAADDELLTTEPDVTTTDVDAKSTGEMDTNYNNLPIVEDAAETEDKVPSSKEELPASDYVLPVDHELSDIDYDTPRTNTESVNEESHESVKSSELDEKSVETRMKTSEEGEKSMEVDDKLTNVVEKLEEDKEDDADKSKEISDTSLEDEKLFQDDQLPGTEDNSDKSIVDEKSLEAEDASLGAIASSEGGDESSSNTPGAVDASSSAPPVEPTPLDGSWRLAVCVAVPIVVVALVCLVSYLVIKNYKKRPIYKTVDVADA